MSIVDQHFTDVTEEDFVDVPNVEDVLKDGNETDETATSRFDGKSAEEIVAAVVTDLPSDPRGRKGIWREQVKESHSATTDNVRDLATELVDAKRELAELRALLESETAAVNGLNGVISYWTSVANDARARNDAIVSVVPKVVQVVLDLQKLLTGAPKRVVPSYAGDGYELDGFLVADDKFTFKVTLSGDKLVVTPLGDADGPEPMEFDLGDEGLASRKDMLALIAYLVPAPRDVVSNVLPPRIAKEHYASQDGGFDMKRMLEIERELVDSGFLPPSFNGLNSLNGGLDEGNFVTGQPSSFASLLRDLPDDLFGPSHGPVV